MVLKERRIATEVKKKPRRATKADLVCAVEGCPSEPDYHMGGGGWSYVYRDGPRKTRFLCAEHREKWFEFNSDYHGIWEHQPGPGEEGWPEYWEKVFGVFLKWVKGELDFCPFCGQVMEKKEGNDHGS